MSKPKTKFTKPSRTQPQFARDLDMNVIVKKYARGVMPPLRGGGQYLDNTVLPQDYQQAMDTVIRAQGAFDRLPAVIRDRFGNSPQAMLHFLNNPENKAEAQSLGLVSPDPVDEKGPRASVPAGEPAVSSEQK